MGKLKNCSFFSQEKVYEELNSVIGEDKNASITSDHLKELKYFECCIKESLRIFPSVPFIGRTLQNDFQLGIGIDLLGRYFKITIICLPLILF